MPLVVIFGRTNVGKSTLFNCLIEKKRALVSPIAGTTRDSNIGEVRWRGARFRLVDTGGIIDTGLLSAQSAKKSKIKPTDIDIKVQTQARDYLTRAALVIFLVDAQDGLLPADRDMANSLKKIKGLTVVLAANKVDSQKLAPEAAEFNKLGLGEPIAISAVTGMGTGDMLDVIEKKLKLMPASSQKTDDNIKSEKAKKIRVAIIGKPNVGKSSLLNSLLGEERVIVSPIPHTTREPQSIDLEYRDRVITLVDTAGISRQGQKMVRSRKEREALERQSITASLYALKRSDIALLVIDVSEDLTHQEAKLVEEIMERKRSLVIVANKWDLVKDGDQKEYTQKIMGFLPFVPWAPIQFISASSGKNVKKILDLILQIDEERGREITEGALNRFLSGIVKKHRPAKRTGTKPPRIYELRQVDTRPPTFAIRIGSRDTISESYLKYISNRLRDKFSFFGTPIVVYVERNKKVHGKAE